jgi:hypothetical protein
MAAQNTDKLRKVARKWVGQVGAGGVESGTVTTVPLASTTNLPTETAIMITIDRVDANGVLTPDKEEGIIGVVSGDNLSSCIRGVEGTAQAHSAGAVVEVLWTARNVNDIVDAILAEHSQSGAHTTDAINEKTEDAGVTVDGVLIKDGKVATTKAVSIQITDASTDITKGDGKAILNIPTLIDGYVLKRVAASVTTAPAGAAIIIQINNVTDNVDILSTRLTIDEDEKTSATAATPAVIDTSHDDVATDDVIRIDVDQVGSTTAGAGLVVRLEFETS